MTVDLVTQIMADAMYTILITALPPLLISMVVGLIISIFQTVTSIKSLACNYLNIFRYFYHGQTVAVIKSTVIYGSYLGWQCKRF